MSVQEFIVSLQHRASVLQKRVVLPDATDIRTINAAVQLNRMQCTTPILVGNTKQIQQIANEHKVDISNLTIVDPLTSTHGTRYAAELMEKRKHKGLTIEQAHQLLQSSLYYAGMMVACGDADCCVAGSLSTTGDVLRAGIQTIGVQQGISVVSSYFLMVLPKQILAYADCGVVPYPTAQQLADIALTTSENFRLVTTISPNVAFLSFSTKGSAEHESVVKVREAYQLFTQKAPDIPADGELQVDAALVESIAARKAPNSRVAGKANILVFPNLDAGNIGYKLTERLAGALALGPIVQGLQKPYCDLSRGCTADDIVNVVCIAVLMSV